VPKEDRRDEKASSAALVTGAGFVVVGTAGLGIVGDGEAEDDGRDLVSASKLYDEYGFDAAAMGALYACGRDEAACLPEDADEADEPFCQSRSKRSSMMGTAGYRGSTRREV
jgi:hypothetical protein